MVPLAWSVRRTASSLCQQGVLMTWWWAVRENMGQCSLYEIDIDPHAGNQTTAFYRGTWGSFMAPEPRRAGLRTRYEKPTGAIKFVGAAAWKDTQSIWECRKKDREPVNSSQLVNVRATKVPNGLQIAGFESCQRPSSLEQPSRKA